MRPAHIRPENFSPSTAVLNALFPSIKAKELAVVMVDTALNGSEKQTMENIDLLRKSRKIADVNYAKPPNHYSMISY